MSNEDISLEAALVKSMSFKKNYDMFYKVLDVKRLIPLTTMLLKDFGKYYEKYDNDINWDVFYNEFTQNWHKKDDVEVLQYYREVVFPMIKSSEVTDDLFLSLLEREAGQKITDIMTNGFDYTALETTLRDLQDKKCTYIRTTDTDVFRLTDVDLSRIDHTNGISWWSNTLQNNLGSLLPGQFILISGDSNSGKSAKCITQAVHVMKMKHNSPILYFTSEDTPEDLTGRLFSNLYHGKMVGGFEQIVMERDKVIRQYEKQYDPNMFIAMQIGNVNDLNKIEIKIAKYNPCLVVIDMLDVLANSLDIKDLTKTYNRIRKLANAGYPIIGTTQAGNTSYFDNEKGTFVHRKWLTEKDTAGSKGGGKQGAAYCMLMIGQDDEKPNLRYINLTKQKRGKPGRMVCKLHKEYSLYEELT